MTFIHHERSNTIRGQNAVNIDESDRQTDRQKLSYDTYTRQYAGKHVYENKGSCREVNQFSFSNKTSHTVDDVPLAVRCLYKSPIH